jgi:hypothetical protein
LTEDLQDVMDRLRYLEGSIMKIQVKHWMAIMTALLILPVAMMAQTPEQRIDTAISHANEAGIPVSLLESKIAEGRAKGVPMDRIASAVESRLRSLERARSAMNRAANDVDAGQLSVGADAIGAGVSEAVLEKITASAGRDRRAVAVAALTQLVSQGIAPEAALIRVKDALSQGPQALANLAAQSRGNAQDSGARRVNQGAGSIPRTSGPPVAVPAPSQGSRSPVPPPRGGAARGRS